MSKLPFMPLYVADYDAATNWCDLETDGLYMRVLRLLWSTPIQSLPNDKKWLIRKLRITEDQYDLFLVIKEEFLFVENNRIIQKRLSVEFEKAENIHNTKVENGRKGGKAKALKNNKTISSETLAKPKLSSSEALASTSTITSTSIKEPPIVPQGGKRKTQWPNDFIPSKEHAESYWLDRDRQDLNYNDEVAAFKDWCLANGKKYLDWDAAWRTRYCNAVKFNKKPFVNSDKPKVFSADEIEELMNESK